MKNDLLDEIKEFLQNSGTWDKEAIINEECVREIAELKNKFLDELSVTEIDENDKEVYLMDLRDFTERVFDNCVRLFCNVLDSYKDE